MVSDKAKNENCSGKVKKLADWKQPRGQAGQKWKTKVQWAIADEYDALALQTSDVMIEEADDEVRKRLEKKALFQKYLDKSGIEGDKKGEDDS